MKRLALAIAATISAAVLNATPVVAASDTDPNVAKLAADPDFEASLDVIFGEMRNMAVQLRNMPATTRTKYLAATKKYAQDLRAAGDMSPAAPAFFREHALLKQTTVDRWLELAKAIRERNPTINQTAQAGAAADHSTYTSGGIEYGFSDIDNSYCDRVDCVCTSRCAEEYRQASNQAGFGWWVNSLLDPRPFGFIIRWVQMAQELHDLAVQYDDCLEGCAGIDMGNRCFEDSDCDSNQYCRAPFGNPYHQCTDKKALGETCSRHSKCASGCCKYKPGINPFSKVCRPSNKCD